jgi:hypothetical protein
VSRLEEHDDPIQEPKAVTEPGIDPKTNLPAVPEGYYWNVSIVWQEFFEVPSAFVRLRKRHRFGFFSTTDTVSTDLGYGDPRDIEAGRTKYKDLKYPLLPADVDHYPYYIRDAALQVLENQKDRLSRESYSKKYRRAQGELSGNYPPKSL